MSYIGIGYSGERAAFLREFASLHDAWLKGDRVPRFFGDSFIVLYDSNTAREFVKKCKEAAETNAITIYTMERAVP
jgi:GGDEF domain-containing protein